jgi:uncharacterized membrane protein
MELFTTEPGLLYLAKWLHFVFGITWIGLLYYFNLVQGEYFKEADAGARVDAFTKLVPLALWYFRWGAMFTFLTGVIMLYILGATASYDVVIGATMGTLMFLNVWLIIWPNQKIVIASNQQVAGGGEALPGAAGAAPKAGLASRTNTLFSVPMLFFMGSGVHLGGVVIGAAEMTSLVIALVIIAAIEVNAIVGRQGPMTSVRGLVTSAFVLTAILWGVVRLL